MPVVDQSSPVTTSEQQAVPVAQISEAIRKAKMHAGRVLGISWCNLEEISRVELILNELERAPSLPCKSGEGAEAIEAKCASLLAAYLRIEIGRLMQQAEHWAENGKPLAVHHRLMAADSYFQILVLMERDPAKGWYLPFDEIRRSLERKAIKPAGSYPPSRELYRYRDPAFVVAALTPDATQTREAQLERALKPFARAAEWWSAFDDQQRITSLHQHGDCLEVSHLRSARAALNARGGA